MNALITPINKTLRFALLLLALTMPLSVQAGTCDPPPDLLSPGMDILRADGKPNHCRHYVNMAFIHWRNITCYKKWGVEQSKDEYLEVNGVDSRPDREDASDIVDNKSIDMAYAGESLEATQRGALKVCRELERREKNGAHIRWSR